MIHTILFEVVTSSRAVDDYYSTRLRGFGPVHLGVDWRSEESQRLRFDVLLQAIRPAAAFSLIDYGCGYGALADCLAVRELHNCEYIGYDVSDAMIEAARSRITRTAPPTGVGRVTIGAIRVGLLPGRVS